MMSDSMMTPEQARNTVMNHVKPVGVERVGLLEARGRILARDVLPKRDNPAHDNSAMDGFAVRYQDVRSAQFDNPIELEIIEDIPAGKIPDQALEIGQASRIMTGGVIPKGADTIVPIEDASTNGAVVNVNNAEKIGAHIRKRGEDILVGKPILSAGQLLSAGEIAVLATVQQSFVTVYRRPRVAIITTGDELVEIEEHAGDGKVVNGNTAALASFSQSCGAEPTMLPIARDDPEDIERTIKEASDADFILSSGGVSVGDFDYLKQVLEEMGAETLFWRVAMKPGKPLLFCTLNSIPYFGLPGNPVSSMMSFLQFVRPALFKAAGHPSKMWELPETIAYLENNAVNEGDRRNYLRCKLYYGPNGDLRANIFSQQGSHMVSSMIEANGIAIIEPKQSASPGDDIRVQVIGNISQK